MQLNNDHASFVLLFEAVTSFYKKPTPREVFIFANQAPSEEGKYYVRFLLDRKHVIEYSIVTDRGYNLSGVGLAIGPHFFGAADFWSYAAAERFKMEASTDAIEFNLRLLDEFLGYLVA